MKKVIAILIVLLVAATVQADIGVTYTDKVVWRGFELFDETDAFAPQIATKLGGVNVKARGYVASDSGFNDLQRWDGQVATTQRAGPFELTEGYGYYYYPDSDLDFQEIFATVGMPIGPATPRYTLVRADADGAVQSAWLHVVGVDVELSDKADCFFEATYNEGFNPFGGTVDRGWSHILAGASLELSLSEQLAVTPAVYYQHTLDEAVNPKENQLWFSVGLDYLF